MRRAVLMIYIVIKEQDCNDHGEEEEGDDALLHSLGEINSVAAVVFSRHFEFGCKSVYIGAVPKEAAKQHTQM